MERKRKKNTDLNFRHDKNKSQTPDVAKTSVGSRRDKKKEGKKKARKTLTRGIMIRKRLGDWRVRVKYGKDMKKHNLD